MRRLVRSASLVSCLLLLACGDAGPGDEGAGELLGEDEAAIVNGSLDYTHDAVVCIALQGGYGCSGTFIEASGNYAWVLTAAHCVTPNAPAEVHQGEDCANPDTWYSVDDYKAHPSYNGEFPDIALVRVWNTGGSPPLIPAASSPDNLYVGTDVRHVGYGLTSYPNGYNDDRRQTTNTISGFTSGDNEFWYDEAVSGTCQGDSGGPALTIGTERVAGVISRGEEGCTGSSIDVRVAPFYTSFIRSYIDGTPIGPLNCDQCYTAAVTGNGACFYTYETCFNTSDCIAFNDCLGSCGTYQCQQDCITQHPTGYDLWQAIFDCVCDTACTTECGSNIMCQGGLGGTGGTGGTAGTGGTGAEGATGGTGGTGAEGNAPPVGEGWVAGTAENQKYSGELLGSSCATRPRSRHPEAPWLLWLAAAAGLVGWARRREAGR